MKFLSICLIALVAMYSLPLQAQDTAADDKSFLEDWLETNLSSAGRDVRVTGFAGALSSQATIAELTIADDTGVWLTLRGVQLDWTRSALLSGRLEIDTLKSDEIEISRRPEPEAGPDLPPMAAPAFALPELPVSISIGEIEASKLILGETVLGVATTLRLEGSLQLDEGAGQANLLAERIDGAEGKLRMEGTFANETRHLMLDLNLQEGANGIAATLTGLPGGAPLAMSVAGEGPIGEFTADINLATDGISRISGQVELKAETSLPGAALTFRAGLSGNPAPLFPPDYARFFGSQVRLELSGKKHPDGSSDLTSFEVRTDVMDLTGSARLNARGWTERAHVSGTITHADGDPVLLPFGGTPTHVTNAQILFDFNEAEGAAWSGGLSLNGLSRNDISVEVMSMHGTGTLAPGSDNEAPNIAGQVDVGASGIAPADPGIAAAIGAEITAHLNFSKREGARLRLTDIAVSGADYGLAGQVSLGTDWQQLDLLSTGDFSLSADDLTRFSGLSGRPLAGAAQVQITGTAALRRGAFNFIVDGAGNDLAIGAKWFDRLFAGDSLLSFDVARDTTGTRIEQFLIEADGASAQATAILIPDDSRVSAQIDLSDSGKLFDGFDGALSASGTARQTGENWQIDLEAEAPGETSARISGVVTARRNGIALIEANADATAGSLAPWSGIAGRNLTGSASIATQGIFWPENGAFTLDGTLGGTNLGFGINELDKLTAGESRAGFSFQRDDDGAFHIGHFDLSTPQVTVQATSADAENQQSLAVEGRLNDLGLVVPGLSGPFTASGTATLSDTAWQIFVDGTGPGGTTLTTGGQVSPDGRQTRLKLTGHAPLALANPFIAPRTAEGLAEFDLALNGGFNLAALSGTVSTANGRIALPGHRISLDPVAVTARITDQLVRLEASAGVSSGGRLTVSGPVSLNAPYTGDLMLRLDRLGLTDPGLYDAVAGGEVNINGPLSGGALVSGTIRLGDVELRVPETGYGPDGDLPGLTHIARPVDVAATQARAGLSDAPSASGSGSTWALNLFISAPDRVFLRGRGLDAELGGSLRLGGTTQQIATQGGFQLIRGRIDLLGNRFVLTEGIATLQGSPDPFIRLVAETQVEDTQVFIIVEGLASDPGVTFTSSPELPEDEILARLVFGRGLKQISPFQALRLASAIATLSGKGGTSTINRLRNRFGLDDLDVTTDSDGEVNVRAGAYISDNIYTDATVGADGRSEINLNLSLDRNTTLRGQASTTGETGLGIFFERDY